MKKNIGRIIYLIIMAIVTFISLFFGFKTYFSDTNFLELLFALIVVSITEILIIYTLIKEIKK